MKPLITSWTHKSSAPSNRRSNSIGLSNKGNYSTRENGLPGVKFNRSFPIFWGQSMKWIPFPNKGGVLIQVDIGGHPPIPLAEKIVVSVWQFSIIFWVLNFWGHFEALNNVFWVRSILESIHRLSPSPIPVFSPSVISFQRSLEKPKWRSYAKVMPLRSWRTSLTLLGSQNYWCFTF